MNLNNINPLYTVGVLLLVLLLVSYKSVKNSEKLSSSNTALTVFEENVKEIDDLKKKWGDKNRAKEMAESILASPALKNTEIENKTHAKGAEFEMKNTNFASIELVLNKILNSPLQLKAFELVRKDDVNMSLKAEISF